MTTYAMINKLVDGALLFIYMSEAELCREFEFQILAPCVHLPLHLLTDKWLEVVID